MRSFSLSITLACAIGAAALAAACGGTTPPPETPPSPTTSTAPTAPPPATTPAAATTPPPATTTPPASTTPPPAAAKTMPEVTASKLADDLKAIGLDINKLPKMAALKAQERSKVMPLLKKATGMDCKDCHVEGDFKKETPTKAVARRMWDDFVVPNKTAGGPLFCDSCHQGTRGFLDRKNKDAISAFMDAQYSKKVVRKDGKDQACTTCHGADLEMHIFEKLWKIKDAPKAEFDLAPTNHVVLGFNSH